MRTTLYVVRHGETLWNKQGKQQGHLDSSLTDKGHEQSKSLAKGLAERNIQFIYSSDLGRAVQTAETIAEELNLEINLDSRLRERHLGDLQGMTIAEFGNRFPNEAKTFNPTDPDYLLPGGESIRQLYTRCTSCCTELAKKHPDNNLLVVTHSGVLKYIFYHALGLSLTAPQRFSLFDAAINSFSISGDQWQLESWGETSHLIT